LPVVLRHADDRVVSTAWLPLTTRLERRTTEDHRVHADLRAGGHQGQAHGELSALNAGR
jgi:hypothetical protein